MRSILEPLSKSITQPRLTEMEELKLLFKSWQESQSLVFIREGISYSQRCLATTGFKMDERAIFFEFLAIFLKINFERTQNWQNLEDATQSSRYALQETPPDHDDRGQRLSNVGTLYYMKYLEKNNFQDLLMALRAVKGALASTKSADPRRVGLVLFMSDLLRTKCQETRDLKDIRNAIRHAKEALSAKEAIKSELKALSTCSLHQNDRAPQDRKDMVYHLPLEKSTTFYGTGNLDRSDSLNSVLISDRDGMVRLKDWDNTSSGTSAQDSYQVSNLINLSIALAIRYQKLGELKDLEEAVQYMEDAAKSSRIENTKRSEVINFLSELLNMKYIATGEPQGLERAILLSEEAVSVAAAGSPSRLYGLRSLSILFRSRFNAKGDSRDLEKAVSNAEEANLIATQGSGSRADIFNVLDCALYSRYKRTGKLEDLERAIDIAENALQTLPIEGVIRPKMEHNLAIYTGSMYDERGSLEDLYKAIFLVEQAMSRKGAEDLVLQADLLSVWSNLLTSKYERKGFLADLEGAIEIAEKAALSMKMDNNAEQATRLAGLSLLLARRHERTMSLEDLDAAVRIARKAVSVTSLGHTYRALSLNNLSLALGYRFKRTQASEDLDEAIARAEEAFSVTNPQGHDKITISGNLANRLITRFRLKGSLDDLDNGLLRHLDNVYATPSNHPRLGMALHNLSVSLGDKYRITHDEKVLQEAIRVSKESILVTPPNDPLRAARLIYFGELSAVEQKLRVEEHDLGTPLRTYLEAWECVNGPPLTRIEASKLAIEILVRKAEWAESSKLADSALDLLKQMNLRSICRDDQEHVISLLHGQAAEACSLALQAGKSALHALQLLEVGRGIIIGLNIDFRSDLSTLKQIKPTLYQEFERLTTLIDSRDIEPENKVLGANMAFQRRAEAVRELDEVLAHIRKLPELQSFQLPPSEIDLIGMAREGAIVIFNSTRLRSDAIIVTLTGIRTISLPRLSFSEVLEWTQFITKDLHKTTLRTSNSVNVRLNKLLSWLWLAAIHPVIQYLHLETKDSAEDLVRIWWVGVGHMAVLPFHAAGDHTVSPRDSTLSYCVSSYTPTIKALSFSREKTLNLFDGSRPRLLVAAMPETPGKRQLPGAEEDATNIERICTPQFIVTPLTRPNVAVVLEHLKSHEVVHFACHGNSNTGNPSESHLVLFGSDGCRENSDTTERLTVRAITAVKNKEAQLIYLSACHSADSLSVNLVDEVIHLASSFQLAGFSHAIGTIWASGDRISAMVTKAFYESLMIGIKTGNNHKRIAVALHEAVVSAKNSDPTQPLQWAPFVHLGA